MLEPNADKQLDQRFACPIIRQFRQMTRAVGCLQFAAEPLVFALM